MKKQKEAFDELLDKLQKVQKDNQDAAEDKERLQIENKELTSRIDELAKDPKGNRTSITSDEEYSSVQEMKEHLKHTRQILIQYI